MLNFRKILPSLFILILLLITILCFFPKKQNYNIIFFTLDTTRADYIDTGRGAKAQTPNIKDVAKDSIVCERAYSVIPITMPSHTSIFTGKYPYELKVFNNGERYTGVYKTLAEILKSRGYTTGAVISLGVLKKEFGLNKGFDYYLDDFSKFLPHYFIEAKTITERGLYLLNKFKNKKFFLWLHYSDPHEPYAPPIFFKKGSILLNNTEILSFNMFDTLEIKLKVKIKKGKNSLIFNLQKTKDFFYLYPITVSRFIAKNKERSIKTELGKNIIKRQDINGFLIKKGSEIIIRSSRSQEIELSFTLKPNIPNNKRVYLYKKEVEYMDKEIGKIIDFLKKHRLYRKTVIVFVGDHGEGLGEYRMHFGHIHFLRPQYIGVPLILKLPKKKHRRILYPVSTVDIVPTLLNFLNIKYKKDNFSGKDIFMTTVKRKILSFTYRPESYLNGITIINNNYQFIHYTGVKRYDEFLNLNKNKGYKDEDNLINIPFYINIIKKMRKTAILEFGLSSRKRKKDKLSEKTKKILKSLGYL